MTINDIELQENIRRVHSYEGRLDELTRDGKAGNLEDALTIIELAAREARRRLRKLCASR